MFLATWFGVVEIQELGAIRDGAVDALVKVADGETESDSLDAIFSEGRGSSIIVAVQQLGPLGAVRARVTRTLPPEAAPGR
jgi:hypothetical protein